MEQDPKRVKEDDRETFGFWFKHMPTEIWQNLTRYLTPAELQNFIVANVPQPLHNIPGPQFIGMPDIRENVNMVYDRLKTMESAYVKVSIDAGDVTIRVNDDIGTCLRADLSLYHPLHEHASLLIDCYKRPDKLMELVENVARAFSFVALQEQIDMTCFLIIWNADFHGPRTYTGPAVHNVNITFDDTRYVRRIGVFPFEFVNITVSKLWIQHNDDRMFVYIPDELRTLSSQELGILSGMFTYLHHLYYEDFRWALPVLSPGPPEVKFNENTTNICAVLQSIAYDDALGQVIRQI